MLTNMESALLRAKGYGNPIIEKAGRDFVAVSAKICPQRGLLTASALGKTPDDAARKLVGMLVRP